MSSKQLRKLQAKREAAREESHCEQILAEVPAAATAGEQSASEPQEEALHTSSAKAVQRQGFAALAFGSDDSDKSEDNDDCNGETQPAPLKAVAMEAPVKKGKQKKKKAKKKRDGQRDDEPEAALNDDDEDDDTLLDRLAAAAATAERPCSDAPGKTPPVLAMSKADFSSDREHRRVFKDSGRSNAGGAAGNHRTAVRARGGHEGRIAHHHRLVLIEPGRDEPWPRPEGCAEMLPGTESDGVPHFHICSTAAHTRICMEFVSAQLTHDPNVVQEFVQQRPFCIEGLLVLAEIFRANGDNTHAFNLLRRAVYAVECSFAAGFSPIRQIGTTRGLQLPCVVLDLPEGDDPLWPGWPWLAALFAYMLSLQRQGLPRTALEICKLLLAMMLPRDPLHVLVHLDVICLHAGQHGFLGILASRLAAEYVQAEEGTVMRLDRNLPNFAYSAALARRLGAEGVASAEFMEALNHVVVADVISPETTEDDPTVGEDRESLLTSTHAALMRAMLLFPQVLRPLLECTNAKTKMPAPAGSPCSSTWEELLERRPFAGCSELKHGRHCLAHSLIADAYARHSGHFWRPEAMQCWLHACAGRLVRISESSLFDGELTAARRAWSCAPLAMATALTIDYARFSTSEVAPEWRAPAVLQEMTPLDREVIQQQAAAADGIPVPAFDFDDPQALLEGLLERDARAAMEAEAAQARRALVQEQDAEFLESLAMDQARSQTESFERQGADAQTGQDAAVVRLTEMGFDADAVQRALAATNGDADAALDVLTS